MFTFVGTKTSRQMASLDQLYNLVKQINEKLNLWTANAKKIEELPVMETMNPDGLLMVSEQIEGVWTSKKLEIQKIIEGLSLSGQDNKVREVLLGSITADHDLNYLLDNQGITVTETELVVLTALVVINNQLLQRQFLWKLGKGEFNPIGSTDINTKVLELQPKFLNEITSDELTSSPSAIVYDFGIITDPILDVLNTASPARDYSDDTRIYYVRATKDGVKLLYNFIGTNGIYGDGELQMTEDDLVLVYSSQNVDISTLLNSKTDTGGYPGTAQILNNRIDNLENYGRTVFQDAWIDVDDAGVVSDLNLSTTDSLSLNFIGTVSELQSIIYDSGVVPPYRGSVGFIKNSQAIDILIPHNELSLVSGRFVWKTPDEQDLVLKPKQILQFKTNGISSGYLEVVTVSNASIDESNLMHLTGDEEVDGNKEFLQPVKGVTATADEHLVTKAQMDSGLGDKVDKVTGKGLSTEDYSTAEKNKLASIDATHYLAPLQTTVQLSALPQADISDKARVYVEDELSDYFYDATASSGDIAPDDQVGGVGFWRKVAVGGETAASIKTKYESNPDTNALTDARAAKVDAIDQSVSTAEKATWSGKQDALGYTAENAANKSNDIEADKTSTTKYGNIAAWVTWLKNSFVGNLTAKATALVDGDFILIGDSEDSSKTKTRTFAQLLVTLGTRLATYFKEIDKLVKNTSVTGSYDLDWSNDTWRLTLTGNTTFTESNLPATNKTKTITLHVNGNFSLTYPSGWSAWVTGAYSGTATMNTIVVEYIESGVYKVQISQNS